MFFFKCPFVIFSPFCSLKNDEFKSVCRGGFHTHSRHMRKGTLTQDKHLWITLMLVLSEDRIRDMSRSVGLAW